MNWGHKIAIVYGGFAAFIISLVVFCMHQNDIHLVSKEYYKEEIAYQKRVDELTNVRELKGHLQFDYIAGQRTVQVRFPASVTAPKGEILFFRPADANKDWKVPVQTNPSGEQVIPLQKLDKGLWKVKIRWQAGAKAYFNEETLIIQ